MIDTIQLKEFLGRKDELPKCEFKLRYVLSGQGNSKIRDEVAKDLIALANTAGRRADDYAYLIIGAGDKLKRPDGTRDRENVRPYKFDRKTFLDIVNARCTPRLPDLEYEEIELEGNHYGVIAIPPSPHMHELTRDLDTPKGVWRRGSVLIRHGDEVAVASFQEMLLMQQEKRQLHATPAIRQEVSDLLAKVQSQSAPLSQCVAEALVIAKKAKHSALERFCSKELKGWEVADTEEGSEYRPTYRMIEVYAGTNPLNMSYFGFSDASNTLEFLRQSKDFAALKMLMREPISEIEAKVPAEPRKGIGTVSTQLKHVNAGAKNLNPDTPVYLYFSPFAFRDILQAVRNELTKHLIDLLPEVRPERATHARP